MRKYFIAGLLVWGPIWITFLAIKFLVDAFDKSMALLPHSYQPDVLLGFHVPGLGLIIAILLVFFTGMLVTNFIGKHLVALWDKLLAKIPLVRSIHHGVKQVLHTIFNSGDVSFKRVLLVEYPRKGMWSIAFQTSTGFNELREHIGEDLLTVFIPTTPNPTSGFLMVIPKKDVKELKVSVDEALKMIISLGVLLPKEDCLKN